jgi:tartrate-resistant acid phosphatase type 5
MAVPRSDGEMSTPSAAAAGVSTHDRQPREVRREPFVVLADIAHDRALVTWGAFFFIRRHPDHRWAIVEDHLLPDLGRPADLHRRHGGVVRCGHRRGDGSFRCRGRRGHDRADLVWVDGLRPDTEYHYRVSVGG